MKICRFIDKGRGDPGDGGGDGRPGGAGPAGGTGAGARARVGYLDGDVIVPVADGDGRAGLEAVLDLAMAANADPELRPEADGEVVALEGVRLLAPVAEPPSIRDFYAFEQHVRTARSRRGLEMHPDWYELPVFYFTNPAAVLGPGDPVAAPPRSAELDYELEVACVLGRNGRNLRLEDADEAVAGFMVMNDWSARDIQRREMALSLGPAKGKDFATSLGPVLVTAAEFAPGGLREVPSAVMTATVNGVEWSRADLDGLWWSFAELLAYASEAAPVRRGDVLGSGTCGTGCILELSLVHGADKYPYLQPGDQVELEVSGLGVLANPVVAGDAPGFEPDPDRIRPRLGQ
jgi:2-keto-4-pentenoate hydratase/2-oxohepta-3-ene-1,7-dioic acid hydratase in catechol pathway